jgi:hypothetical protein
MSAEPEVPPKHSEVKAHSGQDADCSALFFVRYFRWELGPEDFNVGRHEWKKLSAHTKQKEIVSK